MFTMRDMSALKRPLLLVEVPQPPVSADITALDFATTVCRTAVLMGYAPLCPQLHMHGVLDMDAPEEREAYEQVAERMAEAAREVWMCLPLGAQPDRVMRAAYARHRAADRHIFIKRWSVDGTVPMRDEEPTGVTDMLWAPEPVTQPPLPAGAR